MPATLEVKKLSRYKRAIDPQAPAPPAFHHPDRCMNCMHLKEEHDDAVGCIVEGGTKYLEVEGGEPIRCCSCEKFIPAPPEENQES
jgi:hypothetical protein